MNLIWTNRAIDEFEEIMFFLIENWTAKEAQKFANNTASTINKIVSNPSIFVASNAHPYLRKAKISKHNSLIYYVEEKEIVLLRFIDNRSQHSY